MARKFLKRIMPKTAVITENKLLGLLGNRLHDNQLWHLNRSSAQKAFFIGIFCAFIPVPFQMIIAACFALFARANLPLSVGLVWITNPLTIPPFFYFAFFVGEFVLQTPDTPFNFALTWEWLETEFHTFWQPLLLGSFLCGSIFGSFGYFSIGWFWRWHVLKRWKERTEKRCKKG